jgi:hypothetical protein
MEINNDQKNRIKEIVIVVAAEMLSSGCDPTDLYSIQDFLGDINSDENGLDFGDGELHSISNLKNI